MNKDVIKRFVNPVSGDFNEVVDMLEDEDINEEDIARETNLDLETVRSLRKDLEEDVIDSPSVFFKTYKVKRTRRKT